VDRSTLSARIEEVIEAAAGVRPDRIDALLVDLFRFQCEAIPAYAALCSARGVTPATVRDWRQIPLAPVAAFKVADLHTDAAVAHPAAEFHTSGTSDGRPGVVRLADTRLYDAAARVAFSRWFCPDGGPAAWLSLVPSPRARPDSSLGHMIANVVGDAPCSWHAEGTIDVTALRAALDHAARVALPVGVLATTAALEEVMAVWPAGAPVQLAAGSRLMDTGGPKRRGATPPRDAVHRWIAAEWGLARSHIVGEFGMTELSSQRWEDGIRAACEGRPCLAGYHGPPWLRTRILPVDRADGSRDAPAGEPGVAGHLDLANLDTCAFILTADIGVVDHGGAYFPKGRLKAAEARGCGLDAPAAGASPADLTI